MGFLEPRSYALQSKSSVYYSISKAEFNEPEFEEYDPKPYGGGYDQASTYGNPLPPSEDICYPRTIPTLPEPFSYDSTPSPYGKDEQEMELKPATPEILGDHDQVYNYGAGYFYGSGLESVDLCEGLFGYWPCLAKREEQERGRKSEEERMEREDPHPWDLCAEYFFSSAADEDPYYQNQW